MVIQLRCSSGAAFKTRLYIIHYISHTIVMSKPRHQSIIVRMGIWVAEQHAVCRKWRRSVVCNMQPEVKERLCMPVRMHEGGPR